MKVRKRMISTAGDFVNIQGKGVLSPRPMHDLSSAIRAES